ncbi:MAG: oxidoreductase [Candidatus Sericytochromatia bacterium]|nr:oxidoreductase [Candidatus Sericytochromatia bacterium]
MNQATAPAMDLVGTTVLITGTSSGLGLYSARELSKRGARVIATSRDVVRNRATLGDGDGTLEHEELDLADLDSVTELARRISARHPRLDILINNAGVMMPPFTRTRQGFELQFGTNHLGHFVLTALLFPLLSAAPRGRIVTVSSIAHKQAKLDLTRAVDEATYDRALAYADSKLANLLFARELARRLERANSRVVSVAAHPGVTETPLFRHFGLVQKAVGFFAAPVSEGAAPLLQAALDPALKPGSYLGPTGFREMRGKPGEAKLAPLARNPELAQKLWSHSEELTGVPFTL